MAVWNEAMERKYQDGLDELGDGFDFPLDKDGRFMFGVVELCLASWREKVVYGVGGVGFHFRFVHKWGMHVYVVDVVLVDGNGLELCVLARFFYGV
jgi:hypothetical protein